MKKALLLFVCAFCSLWAGRENKDYFVEPESGSRRKSDPVIKASGWSRWKLEQSRTDPMTKKEAKMEQEVVEHVTDQLKSGFLPFVYGEKTKASIYFQHERIIRLSLFMKEVFLQYDDWEPLVSAIVIKNLKDLKIDLKTQKDLFGELKKKLASPIPSLDKFLPKFYRHIAYEETYQSIKIVLYEYLVTIDERQSVTVQEGKLRELNGGFLPLSDGARKIIGELLSEFLSVYDQTMITEAVKRIFLKYKVNPESVEGILDDIQHKGENKEVVQEFKNYIQKYVLKILKDEGDTLVPRSSFSK